MKGYIHVLEAMIAALLILSAAVVLYQGRQAAPSFDVSTMKETGYNCLKNLDSKGMLRFYLLANDSQSARNELRSCLPNTVNYTTAFCAGDDLACSNYTLHGNKTTALADYLVAGEGSTFQPSFINLYIWSRV